MPLSSTRAATVATDPHDEPLSLETADAVLCDFNGTLSDDETLMFELLRDIARERLDLSLTAHTYVGQLAGLSDRETFVQMRLLAKAADGAVGVEELIDDLTHRYRRHTYDGRRILQATRQLICHLADAGVPLALVTGASRDAAAPPLRAAGVLALFDIVVAQEDIVASKPDPEGFLRAVRALGARPERTVVLEDSIPGLRAAHAAGLRAIALVGTHPEADLRGLADLYVDELTPALASRVLPSPIARAR